MKPFPFLDPIFYLIFSLRFASVIGFGEHSILFGIPVGWRWYDPFPPVCVGGSFIAFALPAFPAPGFLSPTLPDRLINVFRVAFIFSPSDSLIKIQRCRHCSTNLRVKIAVDGWNACVTRQNAEFHLFEENLRPPKPPLEGHIPKFKRDVWSMCRAFCLFWLLPTYFGSYRIYGQRWNSFKWKKYVDHVHWNGQIHRATCPKGRLSSNSPTHPGTYHFVVYLPR